MHRRTAFGLATGALLVAAAVIASVSDEWILVRLTLPSLVPGLALLGYAFTRPRREPDSAEEMRPGSARFALGCLAGGTLVFALVGCGGAMMFSSWP